MTTTTRTITITQAEFLAIATAAALHQAEYEGAEERHAMIVDDLLQSVLNKWRHADTKGSF